ncbi:hypothetical protein VNO80_25198 [Phaseolus coccineus]|uniref:Uncharacterized protein n=1 Tax=Phaseolus coccineus TaxID=3886 RepID=A0AAN9LY51_PHACN
MLQDKSTSSSKGKGKAVLKSAQEESRGPQTKNVTCRRAAFDKDAEAKPVNGDSTLRIAKLTYGIQHLYSCIH